MWPLSSFVTTRQTGMIKKCCTGRNETAIPASPTHPHEYLRYYIYIHIICIYIRTLYTHRYICIFCLWECVVVGGCLASDHTLLTSCLTSVTLNRWIRRTKSWIMGMWAKGSLSSPVRTFLMVLSTSQVSLVQLRDDLDENPLFYSIAARWGVQPWGQLARWRVGLAKPSWTICLPDLTTLPQATASSDTLPCDSDATPETPTTLQTLVVLPSGSRVLTHPSCSERMFIFQYVLPARRPGGALNIFKYSVLFSQARYGLV